MRKLAVVKQVTNTISWCILCLIEFYQKYISFIIGNNCRFYPTCSSFFSQAIREHGVCRGCVLGLKRIIRCNPWCEGGVDLVPVPGHLFCSEQASSEQYILVDQRKQSHIAVYK